MAMPAVGDPRVDTDPALRRLVDHVVASMRPLQVWLFGSRARGGAEPDSDYDLLVVMPDGTPATALDPGRAWDLERRTA